MLNWFRKWNLDRRERNNDAARDDERERWNGIIAARREFDADPTNTPNDDVRREEDEEHSRILAAIETEEREIRKERDRLNENRGGTGLLGWLAGLAGDLAKGALLLTLFRAGSWLMRQLIPVAAVLALIGGIWWAWNNWNDNEEVAESSSPTAPVATEQLIVGATEIAGTDGHSALQLTVFGANTKLGEKGGVETYRITRAMVDSDGLAVYEEGGYVDLSDVQDAGASTSPHRLKGKSMITCLTQGRNSCKKPSAKVAKK